MLQDLDFGKLENEYVCKSAAEEDIVICFCGDQVLLKRNIDNTLELPTAGSVWSWQENKGWKSWGDTALRYAFRLQSRDVYLYMGAGGEASEQDFSYEPVRTLRQLPSKNICFAIMTAWHLYCWYQNNRFCGRCATPTVHDTRERMVRCPVCGNMIFPRISPAVIIAVTDGDRILLSKYAGRAYTRYALLAGYTEIGETLEQTVHREVMEEVGLKVNHIRYYKSQPWGVDGNVLMGFFCDLDGDDEVHLDRQELALAQWHNRYAMPAQDDGISLTREMMRIFAEGKEPKWEKKETVL